MNCRKCIFASEYSHSHLIYCIRLNKYIESINNPPCMGAQYESNIKGRTNYGYKNILK